jgi:hypothetical protein
MVPTTAMHDDYQMTHSDCGPDSLLEHIALDHGQGLDRGLDCPGLDVETRDRGPAPDCDCDFNYGVHHHRD